MGRYHVKIEHGEHLLVRQYYDYYSKVIDIVRDHLKSYDFNELKIQVSQYVPDDLEFYKNANSDVADCHKNITKKVITELVIAEF